MIIEAIKEGPVPLSDLIREADALDARRTELIAARAQPIHTAVENRQP